MSLSRWMGAAVAFGLFAVSASGCGGCDDAEFICDPGGTNCRICDGYGCRPADPNGNAGGAGGQSTGSGPTCDQNVAACPCDSNTQCDKGRFCVEGLCLSGCQGSYECGAGNVCINGACAAGCDATTPCASGYVCSKGACVIDAQNPECSAEKPCSGTMICVGGLCTNECSVNADCAQGQVCNSVTHSCITDTAPKPVCSDTVKCVGAGQVCAADGFCHYPCSSLATCQKIDSRFIACDNSICKTAAELEPECSVTKPCKAGQDCVSNKCL